MATSFHIADIVVFGVTIVISLGIGIFYAFSGGRQRTTSVYLAGGCLMSYLTVSISLLASFFSPHSEYLVGGRLMSYLPVSISLLASFESSIMMLGLPAEGYFYGTQLVAGVFGSLFAYYMAAYAVVPLVYSLQITSAFEYLEMRFQSKSVRRLGSAMGMLNYVWYMGIVLFGPAVALEAVTGFPQWISIVSISVVAVIYTSIGGIKAVIWADVFQCVVMFMGMFAILIQGTMDVGGAKKVWDIAMDGGRLELFNFDPDPLVRHTFWNLTLGSFFRNLSFFNQGTVQRISSTRTSKDARRVIYVVAPCFSLVTIIAISEGVVAYSYYQTKGCDPLDSGQITNTNQLLPYMVMELFDKLPGMPGLFLASLFSASLSTLSTGLSSMSAMAWCDVIHPMVGDISDGTGTLIAKMSVLLFGGVACGIAFLVTMIGGTLHQISFSLLASFSTPIAGLFCLGCFCPRVTAKGAFTGGIVGLIISCWVSFGMNFSPSVRPAPMLPPASMAHCQAANASDASSFTTTHIYNNNNNNYSSYNTTTVFSGTGGGLYSAVEAAAASAAAATTTGYDYDNTTTVTESPLEGLAVLYNLSYQWVPVIGMVSTVLAGYIASLLMGPNKPGDVDPRYLLEVSTAITYFLPSRLQAWLASFGTQFHKDQYKANFPSPEVLSLSSSSGRRSQSKRKLLSTSANMENGYGSGGGSGSNKCCNGSGSQQDVI